MRGYLKSAFEVFESTVLGGGLFLIPLEPHTPVAVQDSHATVQDSHAAVRNPQTGAPWVVTDLTDRGHVFRTMGREPSTCMGSSPDGEVAGGRGTPVATSNGHEPLERPRTVGGALS